MKCPSKAVIAPALTCLVAIVCTSAVWIGAYYIGVKKDDSPEAVVVPDSSASPSSQPSGNIETNIECLGSCEFYLVESIPANLTFNSTSSFMSTTDAWKKLIANATETIDIASYYWSLRPESSGGYWDETAQDGIDIFNDLIDAARNRGIKLRITQNAQENDETTYLANNGWAQVRSLNFTAFLGAGILHTKAWLVDKQHFYIGSANLDWRALTQVKELGVAMFNCPCLAEDMWKLLEVYWEMGVPNKQIPQSWPSYLATSFNKNNPVAVTLNTDQSVVYMSSAPPQLCPPGREGDGDAILHVIRSARQYIHIAVMDYVPALLYSSNNEYWPVIDDALRTAAYSGIHVKLMMSKWMNTRSALFPFLRSLADINDGLPCRRIFNPSTQRTECIANSTGSVEVRLFQVPSFGNQSQIPYSRVNHNKYMVTDNAVYIGTSNWSGDYFLDTAGIGIIIQSGNIMQQSSIVNDVNEKIFMRDWNSQYTKSVYDFDNQGNPIN